MKDQQVQKKQRQENDGKEVGPNESDGRGDESCPRPEVLILKNEEIQPGNKSHLKERTTIPPCDAPILKCERPRESKHEGSPVGIVPRDTARRKGDEQNAKDVKEVREDPKSKE